MKALKLEDEKGYKKKNVKGDSNDQDQPKRKWGQKRLSLYNGVSWWDTICSSKGVLTLNSRSQY